VTHAYMDSSIAVAIAFEEATADVSYERLRAFKNVYASQLLEAELRSAFRREQREFDSRIVRAAIWINPVQQLSDEVRRVLDAGYVRGAGRWHLACALYVCEDPTHLVFLTLNKRQRDVARALGFVT
jgi:uncharacterized protein with PIN domain